MRQSTDGDVRREGHVFYAKVQAGIAALAAPVFQGDEMVAAAALVGTTATLVRELDSPMATALRSSASAISTELGSLQLDEDKSG